MNQVHLKSQRLDQLKFKHGLNQVHVKSQRLDQLKVQHGLKVKFM